MTKPLATVLRALSLSEGGWNDSQIAKELGVSRYAVRDWRNNPGARIRALSGRADHDAKDCSLQREVPWPEYSYLLGQYLGDGCISAMGPRGVFRLRIMTCDAYPEIRATCIAAVAACMPLNKVSVTQSTGCNEVSSFSKHWPCLFPQHGPGRKHDRKIELTDWQDEIVTAYPRDFLRGLIHSDGCRCVNNVVVRGKAYRYPRYFFSNASKDILFLCAAAFEACGVEWKQNRWNSLSVAKKESVALLDTFIGPKT